MLLIVGFQWEVIFVGVSLFLQLCGFVLVEPAQQHTRGGGQSHPQSTSLREGITEERLKTIKTQLHPENQHKWHEGYPKASSSGDQGDCTTESHRPPTTEVYTTNSGSQNRSL